MRVLVLAALLCAAFIAPASAHGWRRHYQPHHHAYRYARVSSSEVASIAARNGVPYDLAQRIIRVESGGRCGLPGGGVMQVKARTARSMGVYGDLRDCGVSLTAGMRYLRQALDVASGSWAAAATLYNRGLGAWPTARTHYAAMVVGALRLPRPKGRGFSRRFR